MISQSISLSPSQSSIRSSMVIHRVSAGDEIHCRSWFYSCFRDGGSITLNNSRCRKAANSCFCVFSCDDRNRFELTGNLYMKNVFRTLVVLVTLFSLTGCGLKGPLYFPPEDKTHHRRQNRCKVVSSHLRRIPTIAAITAARLRSISDNYVLYPRNGANDAVL